MPQGTSARCTVSGRATLVLSVLCCGIPWALAAEVGADCGGSGERQVSEQAEETPGPPREKGYENTLKWTTASEQENFGYDVYRSESVDGPFTRITEEPVSGAGTTDETNEYRYVDRRIDPHKAYYYYVEAISLGGERARFTPIIRAAPKLPGDEATGEPEEGEGEDVEGEAAGR